ncbi:MAG TPA: ABC transporter permease subunit [Ktedonobacterales bacterium]|nr:ABC transporter permease subunit [Ktedonobacterales bacterium]
MTTAYASSAAAGAGAATLAGADIRPRFFGIVKGELFKIARLRTFWLMLVAIFGLAFAPMLLYLTRPGFKDLIAQDPNGALYNIMPVDLSVIRIFSGILLLILSAMVIGLEYQQGTIRILLGRGVGRLQLLGAKTLALALVGAVLLLALLIYDVLLAMGMLLIRTGSLDLLNHATPAFWTDARLYLLTVVISMVATLALGVCVAVVGRTLAFGVGVGLSWFAADNIAVIILLLIVNFTNNDFWARVSGFFLGPILNTLPTLLIGAHTVTFQAENGALASVSRPIAVVGFQPIDKIDATHGLLVIAVYTIIFVVTAIVLTARRDVLE